MSSVPTIGCYIRIALHADEADVQRGGISQWLRDHDQNTAAVQWFEDVACASPCDYPAYEALQAAIVAGRLHTVVVWSFDDLFARLQDAVGTLAQWCGRKVRVVSVLQHIDLQAPASGMVVPIMLSLMDIETAYRRRRQAEGIAAAKQRGVYQGRKRGTTKEDPEQARVLRNRNLTIKQIASMLNLHEMTIRRYLASQPPESLI